MQTIYNQILNAKRDNEKLLAILLDPDKINWEQLDICIFKINQSPATHIFVGGSEVRSNIIGELIQKLKEKISLPVLLFPGNPSQITDQADGILFLSLLSGRNPDYLIEHQVKAVPMLKKTNLEIIATGYILIESGKETAVEKVSKTKSLATANPDYILHTAQAGEMLGFNLIYLEAGSGAKNAIPMNIVQLVSNNIEIPLIVGGGIKEFSEIETYHSAGADLVVIGTAFENNLNFFDT